MRDTPEKKRKNNVKQPFPIARDTTGETLKTEKKCDHRARPNELWRKKNRGKSVFSLEFHYTEIYRLGLDTGTVYNNDNNIRMVYFGLGSLPNSLLSRKRRISCQEHNSSHEKNIDKVKNDVCVSDEPCGVEARKKLCSDNATVLSVGGRTSFARHENNARESKKSAKHDARRTFLSIILRREKRFIAFFRRLEERAAAYN